MSLPDLRPYQIQAVNDIQSEFRDGIESTLAVLPTGTGKTQIFCEVAKIETVSFADASRLIGEHIGGQQNAYQRAA